MPGHLWLKRQVDGDSYASDLLQAAADTKKQGKMPAELWFESVPEDRYVVQEHSIRLAEGVYTLLHLTDEELLEERMSAKRSLAPSRVDRAPRVARLVQLRDAHTAPPYLTAVRISRTRSAP